jgi:rhamnosyltransferase
MHDSRKDEALTLRTCAVMVTYHPNDSTQKNILKVMPQVGGMVVVDNGSTEAELTPLRSISQQPTLTLIENGENLGIAAALNQGVLYARTLGCSWVILFDQDSEVTDGFVEQMLDTWSFAAGREMVAAVHPRYVHPVTGVEPWFRRAADGGPFTSMTSGCLMPIWIFDKIGLFATEYFIDLVDTEYSLRIRAAGYRIIDSKQAVLLHTAGNPQRHRLLWIIPFTASHHSSMRRYYISRNRVVLFRKYWRRFPGWTGATVLESLKETMKCFVGEADRWQKIRSTWRGVRDGFAGKMGK